MINKFNKYAEETSDKLSSGQVPTVFFEGENLDKNNSTLFVLGHAYGLREAAILMQSVLDEDSKTKETGK